MEGGVGSQCRVLQEPALFDRLSAKTIDQVTAACAQPEMYTKTPPVKKKAAVMDALALAHFFNDSGWYQFAIKVLTAIKNALQMLAKCGMESTEERRFFDLLSTETR